MTTATPRANPMEPPLLQVQDLQVHLGEAKSA